MNLTLAIPSLHYVNDAQLEFSLPDVPALNQFLQFGQFIPSVCTPSLFYAHYLWRGSLLDKAKRQLGLPENQAVVWVSPVWQRMGMNHVDMMSAIDIGISVEEAKCFCEGLNTFYQQDHWYFYPLWPDLWLLSLPEVPDWQVPPLWDVLGAVDGSLRAKGLDNQQWLQKQTEIQMWLYHHQINQQRESEGLPTINGVWLWQDIEGNADTTRLLASRERWSRFYTGQKIDLPENFLVWCDVLAEQPQSFSDGVLFLDELLPSAYTGNISAYQQALLDLEDKWFMPIWEALKLGRLKSVSLATDGDDGGILMIKAKAHRAFWKKKRKFSGLLR